MPHSCFSVSRHLQFLIYVRFLWGQICLFPPGVFAGICTSTCALPQQFLFLHPIPSPKMTHLSSLESPFPLWNFIRFYNIIFISNLLRVSLNSYLFSIHTLLKMLLSLFITIEQVGRHSFACCCLEGLCRYCPVAFRKR